MDYKNPELDSILDQAATTTDKNKRKSLYFKAQDILLKEVPAPILYMLTYFWIYNKRVHNYGGDNSTIGPWSFNDPRQTQLAWVTKS
jgi:ABC-type transport system substrate-binding protein